jgi:hypothetical protein
MLMFILKQQVINSCVILTTTFNVGAYYQMGLT